MEPLKWTQKQVAEHAASLPLDAALAWLLEKNTETGGKAEKVIQQIQKKMEKRNAEYRRLMVLRQMEEALWKEGYPLVGGIDEAGRGPLCGPVVAACVILPPEIFLEKLNDSKKLSASVREILFIEIKKYAIAWGIGICDAVYIDKVNILNATKKAMILAVQAMKMQPNALIIDAVKLSFPLHQIAIPKADELCGAVSAASILAKVTRDKMMEGYDTQYPQYGFMQNKGYGTAEHIAAIRQHGLTPIHRRSFTGNFV